MSAQHENFASVKRRFDVEMSIIFQKSNFRAFARRNQQSTSMNSCQSVTDAAVEAGLILEAP